MSADRKGIQLLECIRREAAGASWLGGDQRRRAGPLPQPPPVNGRFEVVARPRDTRADPSHVLEILAFRRGAKRLRVGRIPS